MVARGGTAAVFVLLVAGCGESWTYEDQGSLSYWSESSGALHVTVTFPLCMSSNGAEVTEAWCTVSEKDGTIHVESYAEIEQTGSGPYPDLCDYATTECQSGPLAQGTYPVMHGNVLQTRGVTIPTQRTSL